LQEQYAPRHIVLPSQFFDRTSRRGSTPSSAAASRHTSALPIRLRAPLRHLLASAARELELHVHEGGTYVNMDGPAFSTRAESETNRKLGFDVIGMTNLGEAKLAREAEIALATMAMITDYDCWKVEEEPVTAEAVISHLVANAEAAKRVLTQVIPRIPKEPNWPEHRALDSALVTDRKLWPAETLARLGVILERFTSAGASPGIRARSPARPIRTIHPQPLISRLSLSMKLRLPFLALVAALPLACTAQTPAPPAQSGAAAAPANSFASPALRARCESCGVRAERAEDHYNQCNVDGPYIAMTFDDGPHAENTPRLLDMLKQRKLKATFFVVGQCAAEFPQIMKRIVAEGHEVASHSWSHPNLAKMGEGSVSEQLQKTHDIIEQTTGAPPKVMRPPYGSFTTNQRAWAHKKWGYKTIMWDVDPLDWKIRNASRVHSAIVQRAVPGSIILAHDIHKTTVDAMPQTFDDLLEKGFKFVTVSELLAMDRPAAPRPKPAPAPKSTPAPSDDATGAEQETSKPTGAKSESAPSLPSSSSPAATPAATPAVKPAAAPPAKAAATPAARP
jgi:peptidoglycan/xylan/chitin deacetylase (PgdA/CDA1 family)